MHLKGMVMQRDELIQVQKCLLLL